MRDLFRESFVGRVLHIVSGGKLCRTAEQLDPSLLNPYMPGANEASRYSPSEKTVAPSTRQNTGVPPSPTSEKSAEAGDWNNSHGRVDAEKGRDFQLITWLENDPEVRYLIWNYARTRLRRNRILGIGRQTRSFL